MRRTKIIATLGPACSAEEVIHRLLTSGVDVFRLNFSHGTPQERLRLIDIIRRTATDFGKYIPIMGDIQGPKLRIGDVDGVVQLQNGQTFTITTDALIGNASIVSTPFTPLPREVQIGQRILINDGLVELVVSAVDEKKVVTRVIHGGPISSKKGMNFPDTELTIPAVTEKDREDVHFAVDQQLDYIAASFIRRRSDIVELRTLLHELGGDEINSVAKLEKAQAIDALEEILEVSDGVMVARGDLGVELPPEAVPIVQKRILEAAGRSGRFAITATQMLESMTTNSRPTRAEASDVANAIFDGSDAVMLSAETASGKYPIEAVSMMARIIEEAEGSIREYPRPAQQEQLKVSGTIAELVCHASRELYMRLIAVFTHSGFTARLISRYRPLVPIVAFSPEQETRRRLGLIWGVYPRNIQDLRKIDGLAAVAEKRLLEERLVRKGDVIGIVAGTPMGIRGTTNFVKFHVIGGEA